MQEDLLREHIKNGEMGRKAAVANNATAAESAAGNVSGNVNQNVSGDQAAGEAAKQLSVQAESPGAAKTSGNVSAGGVSSASTGVSAGGANNDYLASAVSELELINARRNAAVGNSNNVYDGMISDSDKYYNAQITAAKDWADKQTELQNERSQFTIDQIQQQKDKANKDYLKEASGAYADWQKQSNGYGVNAESQAVAGMQGSGWAESAQVSMYNAYQNRVAIARESYNNAVLNYDNAIKDARLQNNAALAEIAYNALQQQLALSLQGFQYKNSLILEKANRELEIEQAYTDSWQDQLALIQKIASAQEKTASTSKKTETATGKKEEKADTKKNALLTDGAPKKTVAVRNSVIPTRFDIGTPNTLITSKYGQSMEFDNNSILDLGLGPVSNDRVAEKIAKGDAELYIKK